MGDNPALHVYIEGRVQAVGYRYWLTREASLLSLDGWVRNLRDGRVEAVFSGPPEALDEIQRRCHEGPSFARVDQVTAEVESAPVSPGFHALPTV
ncbi:MAG: acylphosphatase [Alphaproteobacteria bacterium]|jgi:acylphosphatase